MVNNINNVNFQEVPTNIQIKNVVMLKLTIQFQLKMKLLIVLMFVQIIQLNQKQMDNKFVIMFVKTSKLVYQLVVNVNIVVKMNFMIELEFNVFLNVNIKTLHKLTNNNVRYVNYKLVHPNFVFQLKLLMIQIINV